MAALLVWARRSWPSLRGPRNAATSAAVGALAGLAGAALWVAALQPFLDPAAAGEPWAPTDWALRLAAACLLVPLCEELLCRGYLLRVTLQWEAARREGLEDPLGVALDQRDLREVEPGAWSVPAVGLSTLVFTLGHAPPEYLAAVLYGLLMASLWIARRDLLTCVVAHAVSNLALGAWVVSRGAWALW